VPPRLARAPVVALLAVLALYAAVWPHELGHATVAWLWGCKPTWWRTATTWYLWNSRAGDVDYACLGARGRPATFLTDGAGIAVNLLLVGGALLLARRPRSHALLVVWATLWALANYAEAFSYLVLNTVWLRSDMESVVVQSGLGRWVWFGGGLVGAVVCGGALAGLARRAALVLETPAIPARAWLWLLALYAGGAGVVMAAARAALA
jgi:hypothetical protein